MKKSHLVHLFWALVAVAAFAIGSNKSPSKNDEESANAERKGALGSSLPNRSDRPNSSRSGKARSITKNRQGTLAEEGNFAKLSESEIRQIGIDLKATKTPLERRELFSQILANLTPENAKLMREQIVHLDSNSSEFRDFHYQWGAIAGEEAVVNGAETPERDMATTLAGWAASNPDAALTYFNGLEPDAQNGSGMKWGAVYGLIAADPNLAVRFTMDRQQAGDKEASRLMDLVTRQVIKSGNPAEAANWATALPSGEMQDAAIRRVAEEYAEDDPVAALNWANTLPQGSGKNRAMRESFSEWARENPQAAADRLGSMSVSPERDSATYGYATRVAWENPTAAIEWANTISNEGTRTDALMETGRAYFRKDPEGAKQWLSKSGLNEEQQKRVTSSRRR
tara:strand:+ start:3616 stop:4809 length:1194 start_codon:yes stop_codon:yes gene_type:complete